MKVFKKNGFTFIEIIIVIAIMAVLSTVVYFSLNSSKTQSRDQKRITDIVAIQLALEHFFNKYGMYPTSTSMLVPNYISSIPIDSHNNYSANYFPMTKMENTENCISYQLWAKLEKNNTFLEEKKGFDSTKLPDKMFECGINHNKIDASTTPLIYDVMP